MTLTSGINTRDMSLEPNATNVVTFAVALEMNRPNISVCAFTKEFFNTLLWFVDISTSSLSIMFGYCFPITLSSFSSTVFCLFTFPNKGNFISVYSGIAIKAFSRIINFVTYIKLTSLSSFSFRLTYQLRMKIKL